MAISKEEVRHIARLAKLRLSPEEIERFQVELSSILDYIEQLRQVDMTGITPAPKYASIGNAPREDEVEPSLPVDDVMANAPAKENNMFAVPKVIDN